MSGAAGTREFAVGMKAAHRGRRRRWLRDCMPMVSSFKTLSAGAKSVCMWVFNQQTYNHPPRTTCTVMQYSLLVVELR